MAAVVKVEISKAPHLAKHFTWTAFDATETAVAVSEREFRSARAAEADVTERWPNSVEIVRP